MILLVDNYDSFVHNLARYLVELGCETEVVRNDALTIGEIAARAPAAIVISPGPCTPAEAGVSCGVIAELGMRIPILGVCLGIRPSRRRWAGGSSAPPNRCTAGPRGSLTRDAGCSPVFPTRCGPCATIR